MVWMTVELAHTCGMEVIAEGVEARARAKLLRGMVCDLAQGFIFSEPRPSETRSAPFPSDTPDCITDINPAGRRAAEGRCLRNRSPIAVSRAGLPGKRSTGPVAHGLVESHRPGRVDLSIPSWPTGPHRLEAQDTALSRRRHGFESRWGHAGD